MINVVNAVLSMVILFSMTIILWIDSCFSKRLTDTEDKYRDLCDEYESMSTTLDLLDCKFEAKMLDDNAEWIINHVSSWGDRDKIGYESLPVIDALADARKALKRAHEYSLTDRDIVLVNREICRQYKRLLKEY